MRTALWVFGMALWLVGAQGAIRLLIDHEDAGLLGWLPGGFAAQLLCYLVAVVIGIVVAALNAPWRARSSGRN